MGQRVKTTTTTKIRRPKGGGIQRVQKGEPVKTASGKIARRWK